MVVVPAVKVGAEATAANRRANSACMRFEIDVRRVPYRWRHGLRRGGKRRSVPTDTPAVNPCATGYRTMHNRCAGPPCGDQCDRLCSAVLVLSFGRTRAKGVTLYRREWIWLVDQIKDRSISKCVFPTR